MPAEEILVVPRIAMEEFLDFQGFKPEAQITPETWQQNFQFRPREEVENDPLFKQFIPYIALRYQDKIFRYWRSKKSGEARLHHLYSIGLGGHINPRDENLFTSQQEMIGEAALRELREEVRLQGNIELIHVGYINDDSSEVGKVHFGIVYEAWVQNPDVTTNEQALGRGEWKTIPELNDGVVYETWSEFLIEHLKTK